MNKITYFVFGRNVFQPNFPLYSKGENQQEYSNSKFNKQGREQPPDFFRDHLANIPEDPKEESAQDCFLDAQ